MDLAPLMTNNLRQQYIDIDHRAAMADDGILDVFMDVDGITRRVGVPISEQNQQTIKEALTYFDDITGVPIRFVATEAESELSIHQLDATPGQGFETWGQMPGVKGLVHAKGGQDNNIYFEESDLGPDGTKAIIYHEMAHIYGAGELKDPWGSKSSETVMGYDYDGFYGYTAADTAYFQALYS